MTNREVKLIRCFLLIPFFLPFGIVAVQAQEIVDTTSTEKPIIHTAYGTQKRDFSTASVSTASGSELYKSNTPNLLNTMFGRFTGITLQQGSGEPGYDSPTFNIRGQANYRGSSYMTFLDGFENPIDQIHPSEIESVTILKDAAALAALGIRGANGVIWVITKRGEQGKTKVNFNFRNGFQKTTDLPKYTNSYDYAKFYNEAASNDAQKWAPLYTEQILEAYRLGSNPELYPNVNWYDEVLKENAPITDADISFSGGSDAAKYYITSAYTRSTGFYKDTDFKEKHNSNADFSRYNFRANLDLKINKIFESNISLGGRIEDRRFPNFGGGSLWTNMAMYPPNIYPVKTGNGLWGGNAGYPDNPVASVLARGYSSTHDRQIQGVFTLKENLDFLLDGLSLKQTVSFSDWGRSNYNMTRDYARYQPSFNGTDMVYSKFKEDTDFAINTGSRQQWHRKNIQFGINYDQTFNTKNEVSAMLLYHQDKYGVDGNEVPYSNENFVGRVNYLYDKRYAVEATLSYSGSENFDKDNRYGLFPTISAAWIISNESFLKDNKAFDFLKLRTSLGKLGNANMGNRFLYQQYYVGGPGYLLGYDNNYNIWSTIEGTLANPDATWEKSLKFNVGLDLSLFKKLNVSFDYFKEKRTDILGEAWGTIPNYFGSSLSIENIGTVLNQGFELDLKYKTRFGAVDFFTGAQISYAHNNIKEMGEGFRKEVYSKRTNHAIGETFGLVANGFYDVTDFDAGGNLKAGEPAPFFGKVQAGDIRYEDLNKDGMINEDDVKSIGYSWLPEYTFAFNIGAAYKGFDFEMLFQGLANRSIMLSGQYFWAFSNNSQMPDMAKGRWAYYKDEYTGEQIDTRATANYPRLSTMSNPHNYRSSTLWLRNGNLLKLRNIELGYTIPDKIFKKWHLSKARVFVSGLNLLSFDHMDDYDTETLTGYPSIKSINAGLSLNF